MAPPVFIWKDTRVASMSFRSKEEVQEVNFDAERSAPSGDDEFFVLVIKIIYIYL